jgi:hypothetical protein
MKKTQQTIEIGSRIPFGEQEKLVNKSYTELMDCCEEGMMLFSNKARAANNDFWKNLRALHPELEDWEFIVDRINYCIQVTRPKLKEL